jgi:uroporphyrinogen-III synthase
VSIGPTTSEALHTAGLPVAAEARRAGAQAMAAATAALYAGVTGYAGEDVDA